MTFKQIHEEDINNMLRVYDLNGLIHVGSFPNISEKLSLLAEITLRGEPNFRSNVVIEDLRDLNLALAFDQLPEVDIAWRVIDKVPDERTHVLTNLPQLFQQ